MFKNKKVKKTAELSSIWEENWFEIEARSVFVVQASLHASCVAMSYVYELKLKRILKYWLQYLPSAQESHMWGDEK